MVYDLQRNESEINGVQEDILALAESGVRLKISLTNDFAFKTAFRNKKALTGLLSALLNIPVEEICEIEFPNVFLASEYPEDKEGILDVKILLNENKKVNIEIQVLPFLYWEERSLYYTAKHFTEDLKKGDHYKNLNTTIHISILSFCLREDQGLYSIYELRERKSHQLYSDKISLHVLQLKKIKEATAEEKESAIYQWAKMISTNDWEVLKQMAERNEYMHEAVGELEKINTEKELRYRYLMREKKIRDEATVRMFEREEGLQQGELKKLVYQVRKKLQKGMDDLQISDELEEPVEVIHKIMEILKEQPERDDKAICDILKSGI